MKMASWNQRPPKRKLRFVSLQFWKPELWQTPVFDKNWQPPKKEKQKHQRRRKNDPNKREEQEGRQEEVLETKQQQERQNK